MDVLKQLSIYEVASSSVQLVAVQKDGKLPIAWGCGMLLKEDDRLLLLTVFHNVMLGAITIQGMLGKRGYNLGMCNRMTVDWPIVSDSELNKSSQDGAPYLDFSATYVPTNDSYCRFSIDVSTGIDSYPIHRFERNEIAFDLDEDALKNDEFSFCGTVEPGDSSEMIAGAHIQPITFAVVFGLRYVRQDDYYIYLRLPDNFRSLDVSLGGTSGSPILCRDGRAIALVCGGDDDDDTVVRAIRLDVLLSKWEVLTMESLEREKDTEVCSVLLDFLDKNQREFYWNFVRKGLIVGREDAKD